MTVNETAAKLRYSRETVRRMVRNGVLAAIIGGSGTHEVIRVPRSFVDQMLADAEAGGRVVIADRSDAWRASERGDA